MPRPASDSNLGSGGQRIGGNANQGSASGSSNTTGGGQQGGGANSRGNLGRQGGGDARPSRRRTMLTADTTSYDPAEIDPETGEVTRFDPNPKKRKRTVLDVEGTPTLDELRAATKTLLGY